MSYNQPLSLNQQLAGKVKKFCVSMGISRKKLCRLLKLDESQFSRWQSGEVNFSSEVTLKLLRFISLTPRDLALKFGNVEKTTGKIMALQESGKFMKLDGNEGWYPGVAESGAGTDPNSGGSIDDSEDNNTDPEYIVRNQLEIYKQAVAAIESYLNKKGSVIPKGVVNPDGVTEAPHTVSSKRSHNGPQGDEYKLPPVHPKNLLTVLERNQARLEEELEMAQNIQKVREASDRVRAELAELNKGRLVA